MNPLVASVIRTLVPAAVGQVAAWLALLNVPLTPAAEVGLTTFLGFAFTAIYYVGVRIIEQQWPAFGVLLGLPKSPDTYSKETVTAAVPAAPTTVPAVSFAVTQGKIDALPADESVPAAALIVAPDVLDAVPSA